MVRLQNDLFTLEREECIRYRKWQPSSLQRFVYFFFPTLDYMKWKVYKNLSEYELNIVMQKKD